MAGITKIGILLTSITGASGMGVGGIYYVSLETIGSLIKDDVLGEGEDFKESWKSQHKKLLDSSETLSPQLASIKEKYKDNTKEEHHKALSNWCKDTYSQTYKSMFSSENKSLLEEAKKYCIQSLGEKFTSLLTGNHKVLGKGENENQSEYTTNYNKIESYDENKNGKLPQELKSLKTSEASTKWNVLQGWCKKIQTIPFKGEEDTFKVGKELCIKTS